MMPDFEGMLAETGSRFTAPRLLEGIQTHHATDHVFHASEPFLRFQREARQALEQARVRTGARRAVAHVGVELLLDAALGNHAARALERAAVYKAALGVGLHAATLSGASLVARAKFSTLLASLRARAEYVAPKTPIEVVSRLERIFATRPALALRPEELPSIGQWAQRAWAPITNEAESWLNALVHAVSARLDQHDGTSGSPPAPSTPVRHELEASSYDQSRQ